MPFMNSSFLIFMSTWAMGVLRGGNTSSLGIRFFSLVIFPSSPSMLGLSQLFYSNILIGFALKCQQVFQDLSFFLVNGEKMGGILLPNLAAHEIGDDELAQIAKRVSIILVHDSYLLGDPMHLAVKALKIWSLDGVRHMMCSIIQMAAAEFLEMTEEYGSGNLCECFDIHLNQVVLQSWDDTLIVLQKYQTLLPWTEELLIVSQCIESLAFMACMEILDRERRRYQSVVTLEAFAGQAWCCEKVKEILSQDLWIKDLIALPFGFFKRKTHQFWENSGERNGENDEKTKVSVILEGILELLPTGEKASKVIPAGFYFSLLSRSLEVGLRSNSSKAAKSDSICSTLGKGGRFSTSCKQIRVHFLQHRVGHNGFSMYVSSNTESIHTPPSSSIVAELWNIYLSHIAPDPKLGPKRFMDLIEILPVSSRQSHDHLYRALNIFLQALFVQQINTYQAFRECSDSFQYAHGGEFSGSLSSSRYANSKSQNLGESPYIDGGETVSRPLSLLLQKDVTIQRSECSRKEYESTSFRIQNFEQELMSLKKSLQLHNISTKKNSYKEIRNS
ncbi:phototropic-responsive NPH3 family protein [Actinidia rufa]|uniref:Phototropic-responsive NPH3 family protein n=1 Tax=Actinidia rufa TaxID=165716 RepID=A0A7J0D9R1_9ERIC|nr:phototropic-responsive NPH3 family protein [Actinidia rufa]